MMATWDLLTLQTKYPSCHAKRTLAAFVARHFRAGLLGTERVDRIHVCRADGRNESGDGGDHSKKQGSAG